MLLALYPLEVVAAYLSRSLSLYPRQPTWLTRKKI